MSQGQPGKCHGRLIVISGPSGVGKSTITDQVLELTGAAFSVSATTRPPRPGEVDGRDYRFVDRPAFERMIAENALLEWAEVFDNLYGTPAEPVRRALEAGRTVVLEIDVQGGIQVAGKCPDAMGILIVPPSLRELRHRLASRGTDDPQAVRRRFAKAREELKTARDSGAYKCEVVNDNLARAVDRVVAIVQKETRTDD